MKSNDGITIFFVTEKSGNIYIWLRGTVEINGKKVNKRVSTGLPFCQDTVRELKKEAKPLFLEKLGIQFHDTVLFDDFWEKAMSHVNMNCNEETANERIAKVENYILPYFTKRDIKKIEASAIEDWQLKFLKSAKSTDLVRRCKRLLKRLFDRAIVEGYRKYNPVLGTAQIRDFKKDVHEIYSREEIEQMLNGSEGWLRVFILTFATLSLRSNEICVLKWSDVDWTNSTMKISRAIRKGVFRDPKTGKRTVEMTEYFKTVLLEFEKSKKSEWIFPQPNGEHYKDASSINSRHFQPLLKRLGIPYKGMYELKHTGLSLQFSDGIDPNFLCQQAGHKDKATTFKYYSKFIKNEENILKAEKALKFNI